MVAEDDQPIMNMDVDSSGEAGEEDEEFYENIEAPKFVDFTYPDHHRRPVDDRYWFCLRVGCDQKHEEELDSEAIYKNFVLRVMAARSPNVRLQKALSRTATSKYMKCPGSAPAKPSRSRLSRLAVISSISGKLVDSNLSVKPVPKLTTTTPKAKTKQVAAKYLTTPRNKKCLPNPNSFRSVQNPKPTALAVPKDRSVAKALVFHSPKKGIAVKTSVELRTPLTKLCDGMKRLELQSQRKQRLGSSSKSAKDPGLVSKPVNSSRKPRVTFEDQRSEKTLLKSQTRSARETNSSRSMKSQGKGKLTKKLRSKEIDSQLREANEDHSGADMTQCSSEDKKSEETISCMPTGNSDEQGNDVLKAEVSEDDCVQRNAQDNIKKLESENGINCEDHSAENHTFECAGHESEVMNGDDKENVSAAFDKNSSTISVAKGTIKKVTEASEKNLKEGAMAMKVRKPKPTTNPKPFRFRTDERGILKEANLEKKVHLVANLEKKVHLVAPRKGGSAKASRRNPHRKHENNIHGNEKPAEDQDKCIDEMPKNSQNESQRTILGDLIKGARMRMNNPGGQEAPESPSITSPLNRNCSPCSETRSRKTMKSPLETDLVQPQRLASSRKGISPCLTPGQQLNVIKEHSPLILKPIGKVNRDVNSEPSRRRRPVTIPKEPNFHSSHRPRSCTKQTA